MDDYTSNEFFKNLNLFMAQMALMPLEQQDKEFLKMLEQYRCINMALHFWHLVQRYIDNTSKKS